MKRLQELQMPSDSLKVNSETQEPLGSGSCKLVYAGKFKGKSIAVKLLKKEYQSDPRVIANAENELLLLKTIGNFPNIITMYGFVKRDQQMLVMMELCLNTGVYQTSQTEDVKIRSVPLGIVKITIEDGAICTMICS